MPPSGNLQLAGKQFWLGPVRSGQVVRFWVSVDLIHLFIGGTRVKTVRSHLSVNDLARLVAPDGPPVRWVEGTSSKRSSIASRAAATGR